MLRNFSVEQMLVTLLKKRKRISTDWLLLLVPYRVLQKLPRCYQKHLNFRQIHKVLAQVMRLRIACLHETYPQCFKPSQNTNTLEVLWLQTKASLSTAWVIFQGNLRIFRLLLHPFRVPWMNNKVNSGEMETVTPL